MPPDKQHTVKMPENSTHLNISRGKNGCFLIYASDTERNGFARTVEYLKKRPWSTEISVILGLDAPEGLPAEEYYREIGLILRRTELKHVLCFGKGVEEHRYAFPKMSLLYDDIADALADLTKFDFTDETILINTVRQDDMDSIVALMQQRVHDTVMHVDLDAIAHNLDYLRSRMSPGVKTMCMVKAKSYGLGDVEIATLFQEKGVDYLGVAYVDEGVRLRRRGIHLPIIVMNPEHSSINTLIKYRLEPEIYSMRVLEQFTAELGNFSFPAPYPVHIKLDTGMHRLGFSQGELEDLCRAISAIPEIKVASIFSHLVASEDPREEEFTLGQIDKFERMSTYIIQKTGYSPLRHILNTSGLICYPAAQYDMVRLGLGLYGYSPFYQEQKKLENCATLSTVISQIRSLEPGETVSYNRRYRVQNISHIATLPIGYADGISRMWGNGNGYVQISGRKAPIVGSICMDMMMVDVTGIPCREGDNAVLIGGSPTAGDIAETTGTIPYEVLTSVSDRVKRIYTQTI